ncbi:rhamnan synthesis F family protein [Paracoccus nototheniae]|uniref:Rhamnan synthesis F family protein n=1 Tax=Paracoccus nototheniae TaxID=2489002 RepID=A0ABW4DUJ2_9RHOB|nr:rhamnan synthesis F family protein [Paracoccus nototheniae]
MDPLDDIWARWAHPAGVIDRRADFRFDPAFYARTYPDLTGDCATLRRHFTDHGQAEGRHATFYARLRAQAPHIDTALAPLITDPALRALTDAGHPGALELAFELIQLGAPVDAQISDFSMQAYLDWHPDILAARMNPLLHYLQFGAIEGGRRTLADLKRSIHRGGQPLRADRPTVLICLDSLTDGDLARTGRDLVRQARQTHNVAVALHDGGAMLDDLLTDCCAALITAHPLRDMPYVTDPAFAGIDHAILSGVEAMLFVHPLVAQGIPFVTYVHEHADCVHPARVRTVASFSDMLIFASDHLRGGWTGRLADVGFDMDHDSAVIPPAALVPGRVGTARQQAARARLSAVLGRDLSDLRLICGLGDLGWRKGSDIFAQTARLCAARDARTVFVWAGDGLNHQDMGFGIWFDQHLHQPGAGNLFVLPDGPLVAPLLEASDAMFLSSRLDPLPDAAFRAVAHDLPVVCFNGATGFADDRYRPSGRITPVAYADPSAALEALLALPRKTGSDDPVPDADAGIPAYDRIRTVLQDRLARQRNFVIGESAIDIPLLFTGSSANRPLRQREREKLLRYGRRRLWRDVDEARATIAASDNWIHRRLRIEDYRPLPAITADLPAFAVHIHAFYLDDLERSLQGHAAFARAARIVITTDTAAKADRIRDMGATLHLPVEALAVPNQGRDILPFLRLFAPGGLAGDDRIWCHLHQKKSVQTSSHGDVWRRFLHQILLGDGDSLSPALTRIAQDGIGLVAPFEPHFVPWDDSRRRLPGIAGRFAGPLPDNPLLFPVGNMFWTRADVARSMLALFGPDYPWPNEPIPFDGTELHLIERLWPAMAAQLDLDAVFLHKPDEPRV